MKIEVHLQGGLRKIIDITPGATVGAVVGVNLRNPDGTLWVPPSAGGQPPVSITSWELILNIPPNVTALANTATTGLYAITADGASATRSIQAAPGETTVSNGDGVAGNPAVGLADVADTSAGALRGITRDAKGRINGTTDATITGTAGQIDVANGNASAGLPTISLADVADAGGGTFKLLTRDAKGRLSGTSDGDTNDVPEGGSNLYFTDARARAAVIAATIVNGDTTHSPSGDAVFDALAGKEPDISAGTTAQLWRGDKAWSSYITGTFGFSTSTAWSGDPAIFGAFGGGVYVQDAVRSRLALRSAGVSSQIYGVSSGGSLSSPSGSPALSSLFDIYASGYGATTWGYSGLIRFATNQAHTDSARGTEIQFHTTSAGSTALTARWRVTGAGSYIPNADNSYDVGGGSFRVREYYGANASINTSDAREKTSPRDLTTTELACASALAVLPSIFQWLSAVAEKGNDARLHCSPTVQSVIACMESHGLDPFRYGFVCYDKWDEQPEVWNEWPAQEEVRDEEGNVIQPAIEAGRELVQEYRPAGDRYSLRPSELQFFIARGQEERIRRLEALLNP